LKKIPQKSEIVEFTLQNLKKIPVLLVKQRQCFAKKKKKTLAMTNQTEVTWKDS
jgi:hypothetical protein